MGFKRRDNVFTDVAVPSVDQSLFDMSHEKKFSLDMAELVPCCCIEAVPGDVWELNFANMLRMMPMISPVMHNVKVKTEYFFVPNRILWSGWEDFITGVTALEHPYIQLPDTLGIGTLADYLGVPPGDYSDNPLKVNALQCAAYLKIYDDWYRAQNFIPEQMPVIVPGNNTAGLLAPFFNNQPLKRAWEHDYFTSALDTPQQGTAVDLPLVNLQNVPVDYDGFPGESSPGDIVWDVTNGAVNGNVTQFTSAAGGALQANDGVVTTASIDNSAHLSVDIQAEAASIDDLREAFSLQAFLERTIRGGARYFEQLWAHFRQKSPDSRLQRAELIGRSIQTMTISEVLSTAQTEASMVVTPVGQMAGHGISAGGESLGMYRCEEHGFIIGLISIIPDTAYQDGLHRMFSKVDRFDYPWPSFAHLGEQTILNKEVLCHDVNAALFPPEETWGYIPRYAEYRYHPSMVAGDFRATLAFWTLGRQFTAADLPFLNASFITADPRTDIFAVQETEFKNIVCRVVNRHKVTRKLPRYGIPATLGSNGM